MGNTWRVSKISNLESIEMHFFDPYTLGGQDEW